MFIEVKIGRDVQLLNTYDIVKCKPHGATQSQIYIRREKGFCVAEIPSPDLYELIKRASK